MGMVLRVAEVGALLWVTVATAIYWNLRDTRLLPSPDHVKVVAVLWPLALLVGVGWGAWTLARALVRASAKHVVVGTAVSFKRVADTYRHGSLLPAKASWGNALDDFDREAKQEVEQLLTPEAP